MDLTGKIFSRLTVLRRSDRPQYWDCLCECGTKTTVQRGHILRGRTKSCGCLSREINAAVVKNNEALIGKVFGRLTVLSVKNRRCVCLCSCGTTKDIGKQEVLSGEAKSCGCLRKEFMSTHGLSYSSTYKSWKGMKRRCLRPNHKHFHNYGGRGIKIDPRWMDFDAFVEDMGCRPPGMTLDRIDVNGHYCKANCKWSTWGEQCRNKRNSRFVMVDGVRVPLIDEARRRGVKYPTALQRVLKGNPAFQ